MADPSGLDPVYGCQNIYVSYPPLNILGGTDIAACGLSALESISVFARISDAISPVITPRAALIKSESIWHPSAILWLATLCTAQTASLLKIYPASPAMEDISCMPNF
jgi:hypothetical protein